AARPEASRPPSRRRGRPVVEREEDIGISLQAARKANRPGRRGFAPPGTRPGGGGFSSCRCRRPAPDPRRRGAPAPG
ncbi:hypothetical protein HMPREF0731_2691, partial [Pseudoroseomonas cervicalis ATCC 49957]